MKNKISDSISFLLAEYKRLKLKKKNKKISIEEKKAFDKIGIFLGKKNK